MTLSRRLDMRFGRSRAPAAQAPVFIVSGPTIKVLSDTHAVIEWTLNRPATGTVHHGLTAGYGSTTTTTAASTSHSHRVPTAGSLSEDTLYHYKVVGTDSGSNDYDSGDGTFTTAVVSGDPAFMGRPASARLNIGSGGDLTLSDIAIEGNTVANPTGIAITIANRNGNITIRNVDLQNHEGGIYITNCTGALIIENIRSRNIGTGAIGSGRSNHIQLATCRFTGVIRDSRFLGGRTEDMLSTWHSGGVGVGPELVIEDNQLQGLVSDTSTARAWSSGSGTGIILSDGGGHQFNGYIIARRNTILTPAQVGIQIIDGPGLQIYDNIIYGQQRVQNNNPMTTWEGQPHGIARDNRYRWINQDGSEPAPWQYGGGTITFQDNVRDTSLQASDYVITL